MTGTEAVIIAAGRKPKNDSENTGTLILDATCAQQNIKYPQDIDLLNEAREKLEDMLYRVSDEYRFYRLRIHSRIILLL